MNPRVVIRLLVNEFGISDEAPSEADIVMFELLKSELGDSQDITMYQTLVQDDRVWSDEDEMDSEGDQDLEEVPDPMYELSPQKKPKAEVNEDYKRRAYEFREETISTIGKRRTFKGVKRRFRKITEPMLSRWEKKLRSEKPRMADIERSVLLLFKEHAQKNAIIHVRTLKHWGLQIRAQVDPELELNFSASDSWIYRFKKRNRIVSRKITHTVGKKFAQKEEEILKTSEIFVTHIRNLIDLRQLHAAQILNMDQSRFEKELHSGRTLRAKGGKKIFCAVGSEPATSHSYMIMPVVSMDGDILLPMYLLSSEPNRRFPRNKPHDPYNIKSFAGGSVNMNKNDLRIMLTEVFWPSLRSIHKEGLLLLLDSWSANKDEALITSTVPESIEGFKWQLIPPRCTGHIQPIDVYFFRPYKAFVRFITDTIIPTTDTNIWHRDRFIGLQSVATYQFSAPRSTSMRI